MSYDSEIAAYRKKIRNLENAIDRIKLAITNYDDAVLEISKITGIPKCADIKSNIMLKIGDLQRIDNYNEW